MVQRLRGSALLPVASTHVRQLTGTRNCSSRAADPLFLPLVAPTRDVAHIQYTQTKKKAL